MRFIGNVPNNNTVNLDGVSRPVLSATFSLSLPLTPWTLENGTLAPLGDTVIDTSIVSLASNATLDTSINLNLYNGALYNNNGGSVYVCDDASIGGGSGELIVSDSQPGTVDGGYLGIAQWH